jgi:ribosomal protein S18 acetylase RimI-like enzyme
MKSDYFVRSATIADQPALSSLIGFEFYIHRHLDWRTAFDWLSYQPYLLLFKENHLAAALACPPDPPGIAWIRLFVSASGFPPSETWSFLFEKARDMLAGSPPVTMAALALQDWFATLVKSSNFMHHQDIVVLEWSEQSIPELNPIDGVVLRLAENGDLSAIQEVDQLAFEPIWQHSLSAVSLAYQQSTYATVAELNGEIIGYQICTGTPFSAHLARLAVKPEVQKHHIGQELVYDLLHYFTKLGISTITVNTQKDNQASLALYHKIGFQQTGESFPVFLYELR